MILWSTVILAAASSAVIVWITLVNFLYLLTQMVIAVEDVGVRAALVRVVTFLRASLREIAGIFGVVLLLVLLATLASILATAGLSLIGFVPIVALAVMPLQIAAWLVRGFVFQYLALTALGAYLTQYRHYLGAPALAAVPDKTIRLIYANQLRRVPVAGRGPHERLRDPQDERHRRHRIATSCRSRRDFPRPDTFPWSEFQEIARELLTGRDRRRAAVRTDAGLQAAARERRRRSWNRAASRPASSGCC